jgi:predicted subunit of tRNA(5-methylaminomethyl-2-thiouridylate) methyltransferase
MVHDYASDSTIDADLRAHILRDYGELCVKAGRVDDSIQYLHDSAAIQEHAGYEGEPL